MLEISNRENERDPRAWWRERELVAILLLATVTYCVRLGALPLFGEETRRALIAREMLESGDWLVPGTQGVFLASRPPLQNWIIAGFGFLTGSFDVWSVRLPSVLSTFLLAILIYGYLRQQLGKLGSTSGAVAFLTMTLVMEFGRSAESEAVFSLFVAASMLLWHWGWMKKWPAWQMWSIGYGCAALGMLTKGVQAPIYFVGATGLFLLTTGNWRAILTAGHLSGIVTFIAIFGAWQAPFTWRRGITDSWNIYFSDVNARFVDRAWSTFFGHLVTYPAELFFVRLMPWSVLLLAFASRRVRNLSDKQREMTIYLTICIAFSFVSVWLPSGSKARYYMPLFPCFAALVGIAVDRIAILRNSSGYLTIWLGYIRTMCALMIGSAIVVVVVSAMFPASLISLPTMGAIGFAACALPLAYVVLKSLTESSDRAMARGVFCIAAFLTLVQICLIVTVQQRRCDDIAGRVEELKHLLPPRSRLVSLGQTHHAFVFFYRKPIPIVAVEENGQYDDVEYFCIHTYDCEPPKLPFAWTQLTMIPCDRFRDERATPLDRVYVGRRLAIQQVGLQPDPAITIE